MAARTFRFASLEPGLLHPGLLTDLTIEPAQPTQVGQSDTDFGSVALVPPDVDPADPPLAVADPSLVVEVARAAPAEARRQALRTKVYSLPDSPHDAFRIFNLFHDAVGYYNAYANTEDEDDVGDSDETERRVYVAPSRFFIYEFAASLGELYATTTLNTLKEVLRRYRQTTGRQGAVFSQRVVDVGAVEAALQASEAASSNGYGLSQVAGTTEITRMVAEGLQAEGLQIEENEEVQTAKGRAKTITSFRFLLQYEDETHQMRVDYTGGVAFTKYPGDTTGLAILHLLEGYIEANSELVAVRVGEGRGG